MFINSAIRVFEHSFALTKFKFVIYFSYIFIINKLRIRKSNTKRINVYVYTGIFIRENYMFYKVEHIMVLSLYEGRSNMNATYLPGSTFFIQYICVTYHRKGNYFLYIVMYNMNALHNVSHNRVALCDIRYKTLGIRIS